MSRVLASLPVESCELILYMRLSVTLYHIVESADYKYTTISSLSCRVNFFHSFGRKSTTAEDSSMAAMALITLPRDFSTMPLLPHGGEEASQRLSGGLKRDMQVEICCLLH